MRVDRHALTLAPGATAAVRAYGPHVLTVVASFTGITASFDAQTRIITLQATALGSGEVRVLDAQGNADTIHIDVVAPAGVLPPALEIHFVGAPVRALLVERIRAAILDQQVDLRKQLTFDASAVPDIMATPASVAFDLPVALRAPGFSDSAGTVHVHAISEGPLDTREPVNLLYSDDPESIAGNGVLFASTVPIDREHPARLYAYHQASAGERQLFLVIRSKGVRARVQLSGAIVGPSGDAVCVGHATTKTFLQRLINPAGIVANATSAEPYVLRLNDRIMPPNTLVAAALDIHVLDDSSIAVEVVAAADRTALAQLIDQGELPSDGHRRRGEYALANLQSRSLSFTAGQAAPATLPLGWPAGDQPDVPPLRTDGGPLAGEYGVVRHVSFAVSNPTAIPHTVHVYITPINGADTLTMWFSDSNALVEVGRVADATARYGIRDIVVAPASTTKVDALFMSDGASWYPLELGLTEADVVPLDPTRVAACAPMYGPQ